MKRILLSIMTIAIVAAAGIYSTQAYFNDTEQSVGNTLTTGTIDIAVDGANPWENSEPYKLEDMKPGYVDYARFEIKNVGSNPANISKNIAFTGWNNDPVSEPECWAEGGTYASGVCTDNTAVTDLQNVIKYDLKVKVYDTPGHMAWEQIIYNEDITIADAYAGNKDLFLGMLPVNWTMTVEQSYRMDPDAGNKYQGDTLTFDITLKAEQLKNTVTLEDKNITTWQVLSGNATNASLTYGVKESEFDYTLAVNGMADGAYTLVAWEDNPAYNWAWGTFTGTTVLANVNVSGGMANVTGSVDLGKSLTNSKVWLVPGNLGAPGAIGVSLPWNPGSTLFETGLIDYIDADL